MSKQSAEFFQKIEQVFPANIEAIVTNRNGGFSSYPFASMNLATHVGDDPHAVAKNRNLLMQHALLPSEPLWLEQIHSDRVVYNDGKKDTPPIADASWTDGKGLVCSVLTADCIPVLIANTAGTKIAAVHAGWRGLASGIIKNAITTMGCAPNELIVWIGPSIGRQSFEVGGDVRDQFLSAGFDVGACFCKADNGKFLADLVGLAAANLKEIGVESIFIDGTCCYEDSENYFSYRRDGETGRFASLIYIK